MKRILQKISAFLLSAALVCTILPARADANFQIPGTCRVQADTGAAYTVKILDYDYDNNTYFSLRDMAMALKDTDKAFSLEVTKNTVSLNPGNIYTPVGGENIPWEDDENPDISLRRTKCVLLYPDYAAALRLLRLLYDGSGSGHDSGHGYYRSSRRLSADPYTGALLYRSGYFGGGRIFLRSQRCAGGGRLHRGDLLSVSV